MAFRLLITSLAISCALLIISAQTPTAPCTPSMITAFTPCLSFATNNATSPPAACCNSLSSLTTNGKDCLCLIATGSIPFQIPINQTLAISLPRACNLPGVPLQCKAATTPTSAPAPAPGPVANGPSVSPNAAAPSPSDAVEPVSPRSAPGVGDVTPPPPAPPTGGETPGSNTGSRAGVAPSAATPSNSVSPLHLLAVVMAAVIGSNYY